MNVKKVGKKWLAKVLSLTLVFSIISVAANPYSVKADGTAELRSLNLGTAGIENPTSTGLVANASNWSNDKGSYVYFGNYFQTNATDKDPIKWRVLDKGRDNADTMLLMSDKALEVMGFNPTDASGNVWANSNIKKWLNSDGATDSIGEGFPTAGFFDLAFGSEEKAVIKATNWQKAIVEHILSEWEITQH